MGMAELEGPELEQIQGAFLARYNEENGAQYAVSSKPRQEPTDMLFEDPARPKDPVKVQHVRALDREEPGRNALAQRFIIGPLRDILRAENVRGVVVSVDIDVERLPRKREERQAIPAILWELIRPQLGPAASRHIYRLLHLNRDDVKLYDQISACIRDVEVYRLADDNRPARMAHSADAAVGFIADVTLHVADAFNSKVELYRTLRDHVLLIQCESLPYDDDDLPEIREKLTAKGEPPFREVWLVTMWKPSRAERVWPS
jgi:hypothetical protein